VQQSAWRLEPAQLCCLWRLVQARQRTSCPCASKAGAVTDLHDNEKRGLCAVLCLQVLNCIYYLAKFGYTPEQVYLLLSCCPCEGAGSIWVFM